MPMLQPPMIHIGYEKLSKKQERILENIYRMSITASKSIKTEMKGG